MPVPASPVLRAAVRWLEHLPTSNVARTRALFTSHAAFADVTPTQYAAAYTWLQNKGLLGTSLPPGERDSKIFQAAVSDALWFTDADVLVANLDALPEDGIRAAEALDIVVGDAFALIRDSWGKVDVAERARVGAAGELELLKLLGSIQNLEVRHVAAESDGYGYDISVTAPAVELHVEVKSTTRRGRLRIYLSRNEFETMRRDRAWTLVVVRLDEDLQPVALATVCREWLVDIAPEDRRPGGRWESVRLDVPRDAMMPGLLRLAQSSHLSELPILFGVPAWPG